MLYSLRETLYDVLAPWRSFAQAGLLGIPFVPPASAELFERLTRRWEKPEYRLTNTFVNGIEVPVTEEVVLRRPFGNLLRFRREGDPGDPRILIVAPMSGHYATMIRGTIETLLPDHDVYVTDWANARDVPLADGKFDLDDYIRYLISFLDHLGEGVHVLAVCQSAVPALAAVSLMSAAGDPATPPTLTMLAGPIDTRISPNSVNAVATTYPYTFFEGVMLDTVPQPYAGAGRRVRPGFMQLGGFLAMNLPRHLRAHLDFFGNVARGEELEAWHHRVFYDEYFSVMDVTAEFYLQTVRSVFQEHELARGVMVCGEVPVDPSAITRTAIFTVEGGRDDIAGLGQTEAAHALCTSLPTGMRRHYVQPEVGHYGVFSGSHWRDEIVPKVRDFIREYA